MRRHVSITLFRELLMRNIQGFFYKTFKVAALHLMCSGLWAANTSTDFNATWFGDESSVRLLLYTADGQCYSTACKNPHPQLQKSLQETSFQESGFYDLMLTQNIETCFQLIKASNTFTHSGCAPLTSEVFTKFTRDFLIPWRAIKPDEFARQLSCPSRELFLMVKDKGILHGSTIQNFASLAANLWKIKYRS